MKRLLSAVGVLVLLAAPARAAEPQWETVATGAITIKNRDVPGKPVREVWAEGEIAAPVQDIQDTLMDVSRFRHFMPYVKDAREISEKFPDGSVYVYTLTDFPIVGKRDYVSRTWLLESVKADGTGTFRNRWQAFPDHLPRRREIIRLTLNEGSWVVTPVGDGSKSFAVYRFMVDPGGWIPSFAANMGSNRGVQETFDAVQKEAQRRRDERAGAAKKAQAQAPAPTTVVGTPAPTPEKN